MRPNRTARRHGPARCARCALRRIAAAALLAASLALPAAEPAAQSDGSAEAAPLPPGPKPAPGVRVGQGGVTVRVTKADCLRLVKHVPDPGVTYQPGVDVHGNSVAGAHLYGQPRIELPETIEIPIEVDLAERYGIPGDQSWKGDAQIGTVAVDLASGVVRFNGQLLSAPDQARIRTLCLRVLKRE
jgi:hypothetical protein